MFERSRKGENVLVLSSVSLPSDEETDSGDEAERRPKGRHKKCGGDREKSSFRGRGGSLVAPNWVL